MPLTGPSTVVRPSVRARDRPLLRLEPLHFYAELCYRLALGECVRGSLCFCFLLENKRYLERRRSMA